MHYESMHQHFMTCRTVHCSDSRSVTDVPTSAALVWEIWANNRRTQLIFVHEINLFLSFFVFFCFVLVCMVHLIIPSVTKMQYSKTRIHATLCSYLCCSLFSYTLYFQVMVLQYGHVMFYKKFTAVGSDVLWWTIMHNGGDVVLWSCAV